MNPVARSVFVFGIYVVAMGVVLMVRPALAVLPFGLPEPDGPWVRILGLVAFVLGCYYLAAARQGVTQFFRWTIWGRTIVFAGFALLALTGLIPGALVVYGVIDLVGSAWTVMELRRSAS